MNNDDDDDAGDPSCFSDGKNSQWMMLTIGFIFWSVSVAGGLISFFSKPQFSSNVTTVVGVIIVTVVAISMWLQQQKDAYHGPLAQCNSYNGYLD